MAKQDKATDVSVVDKALKAAKARKAAKEASAPAAPAPEATEGAEAAAPTEDPKAAKEAEKAAKKAARDAARAVKQAERATERAAKKAAREAKKAAKLAEKASRKPAHMSKVEKAAAKLPTLSGDAASALETVTTGLDLSQVSALAEHLRHFVRVRSTEQALGAKLTVGQVVRIVNGNPRFIGCNATVMKAQRIRCYVEVPGYSKRVYLFTSDVIPLSATEANLAEPAAAPAPEATGTEG